MTPEAVIDRVETFSARLVELTGGEPLLQREAPVLVSGLLDRGYTVLIETGGSLALRGIDPRAVIIMDIKCPGSGMSDFVRWENLDLLKAGDELKFVIRDRADFDWAANVLERYPALKNMTVLFSPVFGALEPRLLGEWILEGGLPVRLHLQLHKYIWHPEARGV